LEPDESMNSAMAVMVMGAEGSVGVPTSLASSSQCSQGGSAPGGDLKTGLSVSDAACGSQIRGSHSYC